MTQDDRQIEQLLTEIDKNVDQQNWCAVTELTEKILSIDPSNEDGRSFLRTAERRLQAQQNIIKDETSSLQEELSPDTFIGRETELSHLKQTLDRVIAENGQMDMLVGEPGIGKSRLAEELSSYAQQEDVRVLGGRCFEERGSPPYWPWVQAVRTYLAQEEPEELTKILGPRASLVATIFPEINEHIPGLKTFDPGTQGSETVRFRLFDAVTTFLIDISNSKPTLLVLDDLHWADESSLKLLRSAREN